MKIYFMAYDWPFQRSLYIWKGGLFLLSLHKQLNKKTEILKITCQVLIDF